MPTYGGTDGGITYDGNGTNDPTEKELLHQLADYFGINTGPHEGKVDTTWLANRWWQKNVGIPPVSAPLNMLESYGQAIFDQLRGGILDPVSQVEFLHSTGDYLSSIQYMLDGSWFPTEPGGGGGSSYGGLVDDVGQLLEAPGVNYGGLTSAELDLIQAAVWGFMVYHQEANLFSSAEPIGDALRWWLSDVVRRSVTQGYTWPWLPDFVVIPFNREAWWSFGTGLWDLHESPTNFPPPISDAAWLDDDTYLSYLQREQPEWGWSTTDYLGIDNPDGFAWTYLSYGGANRLWFRTIGRANAGRWLTPGGGGEVTIQDNRYPGRGSVEWGVTIEVNGSSIHNAVCDGVQVTVINLPPGQGQQPAGSVKRYPYVGWLSFVGADDEVDDLQRIEFDNQIFMPHTMSSAAKITVYAKPGLTLLLNPFTIGA